MVVGQNKILLSLRTTDKFFSPVNRPVDQKQIATEIIYTPAFSL